MFHCLIPFPVNFSNDLVSSVMKRGSNGCVNDQNLPVFVLKWTFTCVTLVFAPYLSLCIFDQEVLCAVVTQSLAGWLAQSEQEAAAAGERPGRRCRLAPSEVLPSREGETFASAGSGQRIKKKYFADVWRHAWGGRVGFLVPIDALKCNNAHMNVFPHKESEPRRGGLIRQLLGVKEFLIGCVAGRWQNARLILDRLVDLV